MVLSRFLVMIELSKWLPGHVMYSFWGEISRLVKLFRILIFFCKTAPQNGTKFGSQR
jgi:hypothetical protein